MRASGASELKFFSHFLLLLLLLPVTVHPSDEEYYRTVVRC